MEEAVLFVAKALAERGLRRENQALRRAVEERLGFRNLVGKSAVMQQLYDLLERVSAISSPMLITGESGTGKELVARALHQGGRRARAPFVAIDCAAISETLLESELFGHAKGAFTGASEAKKGLFVEADGGTLFLDEVGEIPVGLQAKLLRILETSSVRPVGGGGERKVDVRVVAATNQDLARAVQERRFREDIYYRLHVIPIHLPPLRARRDGIPLLVAAFLKRFREQHPELPAREISSEVLRRLTELPWPGNGRELKNTVERLLILGRGKRIDMRDLAQTIPQPLPEAMAALAAEVVPLRVMTRRYIEWESDGRQQDQDRPAPRYRRVHHLSNPAARSGEGVTCNLRQIARVGAGVVKCPYFGVNPWTRAAATPAFACEMKQCRAPSRVIPRDVISAPTAATVRQP